MYIFAELGIGIETNAAGIGIPSSSNSFRDRSTVACKGEKRKTPDRTLKIMPGNLKGIVCS
jgi:hypothetical protein